MAKTLFEVTEENLETGMRGIPVGYCMTSYVDPQQGLFYVGKPLSAIHDWDPSRVIFLLYYGREGTEQEVEAFFSQLKERAVCSPEMIRHLKALPRMGHPMHFFSAALLILEIFETRRDYREDCLHLIAKLPHLVATLINFHAGWGETPPPDPRLGYMENFSRMLQVPGKNEEALTRVFKLFNILHYDHGGGNLSAFVGKAVASRLEDMYGSMAAAMCALVGPRHGRANQDCLEFVQEVLDAVGEEATAQDVGAHIRARLDKKELVYGFGHAVLRVEDPRATALYAFAKSHYPDHPLVKIALLLRTEGPRVLAENPKIANPYPNVDAISGTVLTAAGFGYPVYFTLLFGLSRAVGIATQIVYERTEARGGRGTPIVRPKYLYKSRG